MATFNMLDAPGQSISIGAFANTVAIGANSTTISIGPAGPGQIIITGGGTNVGSLFTDPIAIGTEAGTTGQQLGGIAVGVNSGNTNQLGNAVAIGTGAGATNQAASAVAIGNGAGNGNQAGSAVAIGQAAGNITQAANAVAIGLVAGNNGQQANAVAIGTAAGATNQAASAVAIGAGAGNTTQAANAVAIGQNAGVNKQGANSIVIGPFAGENNDNLAGTATGSILILADQVFGNTIGTGANAFPGLFISPIRAPAAPTATTVPLAWDTTAKEVVSGLSMSSRGAVLPTIPGPIEGQQFYQTNVGLHVFGSTGAWKLIAGTL